MTPALPAHLVASPGSVLGEWLDERAMSQRELAERMSKSEKFISQLINGKVSLTPETAQQLELVSRIGAATWLRMEARYQATLKAAEAVATADAAASPVEVALMTWLRKHGIVTAPPRAKGEQVLEVYRFLGVSGSEGLNRLTRRRAAAFRTSTAYAPDPVATEVMIALAQDLARHINTAAFSEAGVRAVVAQVPGLTIAEPAEGAAQARDLLAAAGVALVFLPNIPKAHCQGVTFWEGSRAIVAVTDRGRKEDIFWFTLLHELAHVLEGERDAIYLDGADGAGTGSEAESRANSFAGETLIPADHAYLLYEITSFEDLKRVAEQLTVSPGIVVGQLHHRKIKPYNWGNGYVRSIEVRRG